MAASPASSASVSFVLDHAGEVAPVVFAEDYESGLAMALSGQSTMDTREHLWSGVEVVGPNRRYRGRRLRERKPELM